MAPPRLSFVHRRPNVDVVNEATEWMIVIGTDAHKRSYTCSAVGAASGELRSSETVKATSAGHERLIAWARGLDPERVWAIEDCRNVSGKLERFVLARGERVVRVAPKLMAGRRRSSREAGKSDPIDALAVARRRSRKAWTRFPPRSWPDPSARSSCSSITVRT